MLLHPSGIQLSSLLLLTALSPTSSLQAQTLDVTLHGSWIERIETSSATYEGWQLTPGFSTGEVILGQNAFNVRAADNRDLGFYFSRDGGNPDWNVDLGTWRNENGADLDFFLFEFGGNDSVEVAPRFLDGSLGEFVDLPGWSPLGYTAHHGPNRLQEAHVLGFGFDSLRSSNGQPLAGNQLIAGLTFRSSTLDAASFLAYDLDPPAGGPGVVGDGTGQQVPTKPRLWRPMEIVFQGPWASSTANEPNPFLDYRMVVRFDGPGNETYLVPGFFDGDRDEDRLEGFDWCVRFTPPSAGLWSATVSFRQGPEVAISLDPEPGAPGHLDGATHDFFVEPNPPRGKALLPQKYVGDHYPRDARGRAFLKGGSNSPENFLACRAFLSVEKSEQGIGILHNYEPHRGDWEHGDPLFRSNVHDADSKGIIGALNYLSSVGVNSQFMMLMNLGGDGQDVHPFLGPRPDAWDKVHYHPGRLRQWNHVFEHATRKGIALHFGLAETETANETWLDGGTLGVERKLFYREMVARFAHNAAIKWTLCEETDFYTAEALREFATYLSKQDSYDHPVAFHNNINDLDLFEELAGSPEISATSQQYLSSFASNDAEHLRMISAAAGHPWIVQFDEIGPAGDGLSTTNASELRKVALYDVLFSGAHIEWYMGWIGNPGGGDLNVEDFRTREEMWNYMRYARELMEVYTPFWRMYPDDELLTGESTFSGGGQVLAARGEVYLAYLPDGSPSGQLDLTSASGRFKKSWFNPRTGEFAGPSLEIQGGSWHALGNPPSSSNEDWVVLIRRPDLPVGTTD